MAALVLICLLLLPDLVRADEASLPPGERPVPVYAGFYLLNLNGVAEREETFDADIYLSFRWQDSRLAFEGTEDRRFLEEAAVEKLETIWWPEIELINTSEPAITNRALDISPDGTVRYLLGVSAKFRTDFDLHRFPFDRQTLEVRVESFLWNSEQMVFRPEPHRLGHSREQTFEGLAVTGVDAELRANELEGWESSFSEFVAKIETRRRANFYVWTVFAPVILIFLISCAIFAISIDNFHDRIAIALAAILACIATQFAISFNLPQISYLTIVDRLFLATYACIALGVLISTVQAIHYRDDPVLARRSDRLAGAVLPSFFLVLLALCIAL